MPHARRRGSAAVVSAAPAVDAASPARRQVAGCTAALGFLAVARTSGGRRDQDYVRGCGWRYQRRVLGTAERLHSRLSRRYTAVTVAECVASDPQQDRLDQSDRVAYEPPSPVSVVQV